MDLQSNEPAYAFRIASLISRTDDVAILFFYYDYSLPGVQDNDNIQGKE